MSSQKPFTNLKPAPQYYTLEVMIDKWPNIPDNHSLPWKASSGMIKLATSLLTKAFLRTTQRVQTKNMDGLIKAIQQKSRVNPLITVSNHASCLDDPTIWGTLPVKTAISSKLMRWTPAASEYVFANSLYSWLFSRVQLVPITRGLGVYQQGLNHCISLLNQGKWIHIFPEGKVNMSLDKMRLKWGVGRMFSEAKSVPTVIPIWHVGMDDILPNKAPYIPRLFKKLTIVVGEPIDFSSMLQSQTDLKVNAVVLRKQITDVVGQKLYGLKNQAEALHRDWVVRSPIAYRML